MKYVKEIIYVSLPLGYEIVLLSALRANKFLPIITFPQTNGKYCIIANKKISTFIDNFKSE